MHEAIPLLKMLKDCGYKTQFNPVMQHPCNTGLTVDCVECSKQQLVYTAKKLTESEKNLFNHVISNKMYTCGSMLAEFKDPTNPNNCHYDNLGTCFVKISNTCAKPWSHYTKHATTLIAVATVVQNNN